MRIIYAFVIAIGMLLSSMTGFSQDNKPENKDPKYELKFSITFNELETSKILPIIQRLLIENKDACKVEVSIKKPDSGNYLIWDSGNNTLSLPSGAAGVELQ